MSKAEAKKQQSGEQAPADFRTLVGFDRHLTLWSSLVTFGKLPPVLLLDGRAGLGKRKLAAALAAMHVCGSMSKAGPCGICQGCQWFLAGEHPEVLWLEHGPEGEGDGKVSAYAVADAEALQDHLSLKPEGGVRRRVAVLIDADLLTNQAANRLLKTLEEPPDAGLIILTTSRRRQLLPTVLSRAVRWVVAPPPTEVSQVALEVAYESLCGVKAPVGYIAELLRRTALAPERALALLQEEMEDRAQLEAGEAAQGRQGRQHALFEALMHAANVTGALQAAEAIARRKDLSAFLLLEGLEIQLNEEYRQLLGLAQESDLVRPSKGLTHAPVEMAALKRRRQLLRDAKRLASRGRVPLNTQLAAEAFAMSQL